jgi:hypothetical protein
MTSRSSLQLALGVGPEHAQLLFLAARERLAQRALGRGLRLGKLAKVSHAHGLLESRR